MTVSSGLNSSLYVVATPIGNLDDMVPRAVQVLQSVDVIAAEDTRHSKRLMQHFNISTPLVAYHDHTGANIIDALTKKLADGQSIALISDAGTPLISDPGYRLVDAALTAGIQVVPVPGASAAIAALSAAGLPSDRFMFEGFLNAKQQARTKQLQALKDETGTLIFYEAPHRVLACLRDMVVVFGAERQVVMARELTKTFETIKRATVAELADWVEADHNQQKGECVLLVHGADKIAGSDTEGYRVFDILAAELPLKQAAALAAKITGGKKNQLYQYGLDQQQD
ncbi:16S rRNA (cytidine(1402)-2'-O)-methyltransferase [uncultured Oceanicoccus sp.]|uniref:16S rRNA (cytidine(1402)-2'-O)-methyltransferase n=1 Tax=uncultured Oceanicoccus sp. TaxID=1706381 RepID=UPI0030DD4657